MKKQPVMRPMREHFDTLDEQTRANAYHAVRKSPGIVSDLTYPSSSLAAALATAIRWEGTDEGHEYWNTEFEKAKKN